MVLVRFLRVFASTLDCFLSYHRNPRWHGYEAGEYALTDNQGHPSSRAIVAGAFAKATEKYRFELWDAVDEPIVGILISWESEATYAQLALRGVPLACSASECKEFHSQLAWVPSRSRLGVASTLLNANIPFQFVREEELSTLGKNYKILYLPSLITLPTRTWAVLAAFVQNGGRLVVHQPFMLYDEFGELVDQNNTIMNAVFGAHTKTLQSVTDGRRWLVGNTGVTLSGRYAELRLTGGKVTQSFVEASTNATTNEVAAVENSYGKGSSVLLNFEASLMQFDSLQRQEPDVQHAMKQMILGEDSLRYLPKWRVIAAAHVQTFRRVHSTSHHYFLINTNPVELSVTLDVSDTSYTSATDAITGLPIPIRREERGTPGTVVSNMTIAASDGRWLRLQLA